MKKIIEIEDEVEYKPTGMSYHAFVIAHYLDRGFKDGIILGKFIEKIKNPKDMKFCLAIHKVLKKIEPKDIIRKESIIYKFLEGVEVK